MASALSPGSGLLGAAAARILPRLVHLWLCAWLACPEFLTPRQSNSPILCIYRFSQYSGGDTSELGRQGARWRVGAASTQLERLAFAEAAMSTVQVTKFTNNKPEFFVPVKPNGQFPKDDNGW